MNPTTSKRIIWAISIVVPLVVAVIANPAWPKIDVGVDLSFLAKVNATINSCVTLCLLGGLYFIKTGRRDLHKLAMSSAFWLSGLFLLSYVVYHLTVGHVTWCEESPLSKKAYLIFLYTHIGLSGGVLPLVLFTIYRAWNSEFDKHKKMAKYTFPIWLYVAITGVMVYFFIAPCR